jgi:photosystem II stability/assembly factor-like uncharacterized protein
MLDSTTAVVVGHNGVIVRTTNAGETWTLIDSGGGIRWNAVAFCNAKNGFVVGDRLAGASTTDGGETWSYWYSTGVPNLVSVASVGDNLVFMADDSGWVRRSTDGGITWDVSRLPYNTPATWLFFANVSYDSFVGYAVTYSTVFRTADSCRSWQQEHSPFTRSDVPFRGSFDSSSDVAFIVGYNGGPGSQQPLFVQRAVVDTFWQVCAPSTPLGMPCELHDVDAVGGYVYACGSCGLTVTTNAAAPTLKYAPYTAGVTCSLNAIDFFDELRGFAVGDSGTILHTTDGGVVGIHDAGHRPPAAFDLEQNYPNPFNPATTISFTLPSKSFVSLKVFDALGREVALLLSEEFPAGTYARQWNAAGFANGVYFCRLQAGNHSEAKKLVLLK